MGLNLLLVSISHQMEITWLRARYFLVRSKYRMGKDGPSTSHFDMGYFYAKLGSRVTKPQVWRLILGVFTKWQIPRFGWFST